MELKDLTIEQLKAGVYDRLVTINQVTVIAKNKTQELNNEITAMDKEINDRLNPPVETEPSDETTDGKEEVTE